MIQNNINTKIHLTIKKDVFEKRPKEKETGKSVLIINFNVGSNLICCLSNQIFEKYLIKIIQEQNMVIFEE